jgi:type VI protein secretion system component VasF
MEQILSFIQSQDLFAWVGAATALLTAVIAVASLIPGDEPEATLQKIVDFLSKFSRK